MKQFDLEKALGGEPVVLRNGSKAVIFGRIPDSYTHEGDINVTFPLFGITLNEDNTVNNPCVTWRDDGRIATSASASDIIGMYEETKLTTEEIMEKAFNESLVLKHSRLLPEYRGFRVVGKTLDNDYILQDCDNGNMYFAYVFNENIVWSIKD